MTIKTLLAAAPLVFLATALVSACGGGGGGESSTSATTPAKFASPDDVAVLVSGYSGSLGALGSLGSLDPSSFSAKRANSERGLTAKNARPKATTTENCDSGTVSFTDDTSTAFTRDGTTRASNCKTTETRGSDSFSTSFNGKLSDRCTDNRQTSSNCLALATRVADGASGTTTLDLNVAGTESGTRYEVEIRTKADIANASNGDVHSSNINATVLFNDKANKFSGTAFYDNINSTYTFNPNTGGASETINGGFGLSTSNSKCTIGRVQIRTDSPLVYNDGINTVSGRLTLTDGNSQGAQVNFNSDGGFTVTLPNGQSKTYTAGSFDTLC